MVFLGTGDAFAAGGRNQATYLVEIAGCRLLLDCGPAALASLQRHGVPVSPIEMVLISHFHGDHFGGLPFLFLYFAYVEPRRSPLTVAGPPELKLRVLRLFEAMYPDSPVEEFPYSLEFVELAPGSRFMMKGVSIEPFVVPHQQDPPSFGYVIESDEKKIVYSGDTGWTEDLVMRARGSDLFICECSFFETRLETHLDYPKVLENAARFGSKRVVLTHIGGEVLRREGEVELEMGYDGMIVSF